MSKELKEYIVTLHNREDLESFYDDMETPGGNLYIPDRKVELTSRRPISRNTHYMLTEEEAIEVKNDPRVWDVESMDFMVANLPKPNGYSIENGAFDKSAFFSLSYINWGIARHVSELNSANWGTDGVSTLNETVTITASGKNVDVVIVDGHFDPAHPEFAVNSDGTGGSRVQQINWFNYGGSGNYVYTPYVDAGDANLTNDNNHGCHVAGTVAGNTQGWARDANIYNINPYGTNPNGSAASVARFDYIRQWHNTKAVNPSTGRRNPTITNHSYGSVIPTTGYDASTGAINPINRIVYRGVDYNPGRDLNISELNARGVYGSNVNAIEIPAWFTAYNADVEDAIADGVIIVSAAGNGSWKIVKSGNQDYNNLFYYDYFGFSQGPYALHRDDGAVGALGNDSGSIIVGSLNTTTDERKSSFSECGDAVTIYAAGGNIQSSVHTPGVADSRNTSYYQTLKNGTSMASPQVCGILALLAETKPGITQSEARQWLIDNGVKDEMFDSGADDATDVTSLQGAPNLLVRWINQRKESGATYPLQTTGARSLYKVKYPRRRIKR